MELEFSFEVYLLNIVLAYIIYCRVFYSHFLFPQASPNASLTGFYGTTEAVSISKLLEEGTHGDDPVFKRPSQVVRFDAHNEYEIMMTSK